MNVKLLCNAGLVVVVALLSASPQALGQTVFSAVGQNGTDIQTAVDSFRANLGALTSGASTGLGPNARREVSWDAVPDDFSSGGANPFPGDFFNKATGNPPSRVRGIQFTTTGTLEVSADADSDGDGNPGPTATLFGNRHPDNPFDFAAFSAERIFGLNGSSQVDVTFSLPGTPGVAATVRGFGAVFTDMEEAGTTKLAFYDANDQLIATQAVPEFPLNGAGDTFKSFSFVGIAFVDPVVSRVRITNGSFDLSLVSVGSGNDATAMDDFIYGEPVAVPEPCAIGLALFGIGLAVRRRVASVG